MWCLVGICRCRGGTVLTCVRLTTKTDDATTSFQTSFGMWPWYNYPQAVCGTVIKKWMDVVSASLPSRDRTKSDGKYMSWHPGVPPIITYFVWQHSTEWFVSVIVRATLTISNQNCQSWQLHHPREEKTSWVHVGSRVLSDELSKDHFQVLQFISEEFLKSGRDGLWDPSYPDRPKSLSISQTSP